MSKKINFCLVYRATEPAFYMNDEMLLSGGPETLKSSMGMVEWNLNEEEAFEQIKQCLSKFGYNLTKNDVDLPHSQ